MKTLYRLLLRSRGQGTVETALLLFIAVIAVASVMAVQNSTEESLTKVAMEDSARNPRYDQIKKPPVPKAEDVWTAVPEYVSNGSASKIKKPPVAFFTVPERVYVGERVIYTDSSFDPDGDEIVSREWTGKQSVFNSTGTYEVSLKVEDSDGMTGTFTVQIEVVHREGYTKIESDHKNEIRTLIRESTSSNSTSTRIIDHKYGEHTDLYGRKHLVILRNYVERSTERTKTVEYEIKVPLVEVTYSGSGQVVSSKPYMINGRQQYLIKKDTQSHPEVSNKTVKWENNTWTYYVYNEISSVIGNEVYYGVRNSSIDYPRFYPEVQRTIQNPSSATSRDTRKLAQNASGAAAPSSRCKTCTKPNEFTRRDRMNYQYDTLYCRGVSIGSRTTYSQRQNWIEHSAYDVIYRYSATNSTSASPVTSNLLRETWRTEGWQVSEQAGSSAISRPQYDNCPNPGWSSNCWQSHSNSGTVTSSERVYANNFTRTSTILNTTWRPIPGDKDGKTERWVIYETRSPVYAKRYSCSFNGNRKTSETYIGNTLSHYEYGRTGWVKP